MPERRHVTPTQLAKEGRWEGQREPGEKFTQQQKEAMLRRRSSLEGWASRPVQVRKPRERTALEIAAYFPVRDAYVDEQIECPIISKGLEKDQIICPDGSIDFIPCLPAKRRKRT